MPNVNPTSASKPFIPVTSVASDPSRPSSSVGDTVTGDRNTSERGVSQSQQVASSSVSGSNTFAATKGNFFRTIVQSVQKSFEVRQPPQQWDESPDEDATRHSPPPKRGPGYVPALAAASGPRNAINAVAPLSSSARADGSAASAPRPAHIFSKNATPQKRDKATPYFSDRRDNEADLNGDVKDDQERSIECRHLSMYWEEQFRANHGKVPYDRISTPGNILRNVPVDRYENAYEQPATVHLVTHSGWGAMIAHTLREMDDAGEDTRTLGVHAPVHSMALGLKIKQTETDPVRVIQFYDPNHTTTHNRVAVLGNDLSAIERLTAADFIEPEDLDSYSSDGNITAFFDRRIPVTRNRTGHVQTTVITPQEMYLAMGRGLNDHITSRTEQILSRPGDIESLLKAQVIDDEGIKTPGLAVALQDGHAEAIRAWGNVLLRSELSQVQHAELLHAQRSDGTAGVHLALQEGHAEAVRVWGEVLLRSKLSQAQLEALLSALGSNRIPGLAMALQKGHADAVRAWGDVLLNSGLSQAQCATLLFAGDANGIPGLTMAFFNGHAEAIRAWGEVLLSGLDQEMCATLLSKISSDGTLLYTALREGHAEAIRAWAGLARDAGFIPESLEALLAEECPDVLQQILEEPLRTEIWEVPVSVPYCVPSQAPLPSHPENSFTIPDMDALFSDEPSEREEDEYADIILSRAAEYSVSEHDLEAIKQGISRAVNASRSYLVDLHTADLIEETISGAVSMSATFRSVVGYSRLDNTGYKEKIENIRYKNIYEEDADSANGVVAICEAQEDIIGPFVSFSLAPDIDSEYMSSWKLGLIHEVIHHLTGSSDPEGEYSQTHLGPTEVIARKIADEMKLSVPDFAGYDAEERVEHLALRNNAIIGEGARRNGVSENDFTERLLKLSKTPSTPFRRNTKQGPADTASPPGSKPDAPGPSSAVPYQALSVPNWAAALPDLAQQRAAQLATPGSWNNEGGDLMPFLLASEFPQVTFRILNGNHIHTFNDGQSRVAYLTREGDHYTPWVTAADGTQRQETVPPNGDCFFASAFFAVHGRPALPAEIRSMRERFSRHYATDADHYDRFLLDPALMSAVSTTRALAVSRENYQARVATGQPVELDEVAPATRNARSDEQDGSLRGGARTQQAVNKRMADLAAEVAAASAQIALPGIVTLAREYRTLDTLNEFARKTAVRRKNIGMDMTDAHKDAVLKVLVAGYKDYWRHRNNSWQPQASDILTKADIPNAINTVIAQQQEGTFELWLDGWAPWQTYLKTLTDAQRAELGTLGNSGELTRLANDARTDQIHQALMRALDQAIQRTWRIGDPLDDNVKRTHQTFRKRLLRQAELLDTPMRSQAAGYLTSMEFLKGANATLEYSDKDFDTDVEDRILLLQTLTQAVREATPQGVANTHYALFHDLDHNGALITNLFRIHPVMTDRRSDRDQLDSVTANLIPLLDAIVERQLPEIPQARTNMQAQVANARVVRTSHQCSGHSLLEYHTRKVRSGLSERLPVFMQSSKSKAKIQEAHAVLAALDQADLLSTSARALPQVAPPLSTPAPAHRTAFLANSLSPVRQPLRASAPAKKKPSNLAALVRALAPVVRQECARPMDMPTVYRFLALHNRVTGGGADMLYRAEYLGLIGRALVHPENHSLAIFALSDAAVQRAMRATSLTETDFDRLVRASTALTVDRSAGAEDNTMEWNNPELIRDALSLAERYHMLSTLQVRARWNRHRLNNEVERQLKRTFEEQLRAALKNAYRKASLLRPGNSEMRRIIEKTWEKVKNEWISAAQKEAKAVFESHVGRVLARVARDLQHDPESIGEVQSATVDISMGGWLVQSVLAGREQEAPRPVANTDNLELLTQLYYDVTQKLGRSITEVERLLGVPLTRGPIRSRLRQQGMNAVEEDISRLTMVNEDQILMPDPAGIMRQVAQPTLRLRPASRDDHHEADSIAEQQAREIRSLDETNMRAALALTRVSNGEGGLGGAIYQATGRVAWELGSAAHQEPGRAGAPVRSAENRPAADNRILQITGTGVQPPQAISVRAGTDIQRTEFPGQAGVSAAGIMRGAAPGAGSDAVHKQDTLRSFKNDRREVAANDHYRRGTSPSGQTGMVGAGIPVPRAAGPGTQAREQRTYSTTESESIGINLRRVGAGQPGVVGAGIPVPRAAGPGTQAREQRTYSTTESENIGINLRRVGAGQTGVVGAGIPVPRAAGPGTRAREQRTYNTTVSGSTGINLRRVSAGQPANMASAGTSGRTTEEEPLLHIAQEYRRAYVRLCRERDREEIKSADIPTLARKAVKVTEKELAQALAYEAEKEAEEEKARKEKREEEEKKQQEELKQKEEERKRRAAAASTSNTEEIWPGYYQMSPTGTQYSRHRVRR